MIKEVLEPANKDRAIIVFRVHSRKQSELLRHESEPHFQRLDSPELHNSFDSKISVFLIK